MFSAKACPREQWGGIVSNMISRGAKGTDAEFAQIVDYLAPTFRPNPRATPAPVKRKRGGSLIDQAGAADKQIVDDEAAARGKRHTSRSASAAMVQRHGVRNAVPTSSVR